MRAANPGHSGVNGQMECRSPFYAPLCVLLLVLLPARASAQLTSDHMIVPGSRIGGAESAPSHQRALVRQLGEPDRTEQRGGHEYYMYGSPWILD